MCSSRRFELRGDLADERRRQREDDVARAARVEVRRELGEELRRHALGEVDGVAGVEQAGDAGAQQRPEEVLGDPRRHRRGRDPARERDPAETAVVVVEHVVRALAQRARVGRIQAPEVVQALGRRVEQPGELHDLGVALEVHPMSTFFTRPDSGHGR